jgi:hypothetical protein
MRACERSGTTAALKLRSRAVPLQKSVAMSDLRVHGAYSRGSVVLVDYAAEYLPALHR